jgi:murein DD-endopeptidase MepM/ murein hydrolase activator NlpD
MAATTATHPLRALARSSRPKRAATPWALAGLTALAMSGAALAALPRAETGARDGAAQWRALGIAPLNAGGSTGLRMEARATVQPIEAAPVRERPFALAAPAPPPADTGPVRIRGRVGDGLYWSLRSSGASPAAAAHYLTALAKAVDVGADVAVGDSFDMVFARPGGELLYAGLDRSAERDVQLVRWGDGGWIDAADLAAPRPSSAAMLLPAAGPITSHFGHRVHPILRFTRFHAGVDIGAGWGAPIVAAGDGRVIGASWAGGYGRQVRIAHGDGLVSTYSHMSSYAVAPGTVVRRGQTIGYVGSSGFSTGPHLHFEIRRGGAAINPLAVRLAGTASADPRLAARVKARLKALLSVGTKASA